MLKSSAESHGFIDLSSVVSVEAVVQKKDPVKVITVVTKFGRTFLLRASSDDESKTDEWIRGIEAWRKWLADGGSDSPPMERRLSPRNESQDIKPVARGLSGAITRTKLGLKKGAQSMGTLVTATVAKGKGDGEDDVQGVKKCGWLIKKGQKRWFALKDDELMWFKEAQTSANAVRADNAAGFLPLKEGCVVRRVQEKAALVVVSPTGKPYELVAFDNGARDVWMHYLTEACGGQRFRAATIKQTPALQSSQLSGWLMKRADLESPWKKVWALQQELDLAFYKDDQSSGAPLESFSLRSIGEVLTTWEDGELTFEARTDDKCHYFMALTADDLDSWTMGMGKYCRKSSKPSMMKPKMPDRKPQEAGDDEVQVSDTLIVKKSGTINSNMPDLPSFDSDEEEAPAQQQNSRVERENILDRLELQSSDEEVLAPLKMKADSKQSHDMDEDFDSLMDALGSEKAKVSMRVSQNKVDELEEDSIDDMFNAAASAKSIKKTTVITEERASPSGLSQSSRSIPRKSEDPEERRTRSRTQIQARLAMKQKEMELKQSGEISPRLSPRGSPRGSPREVRRVIGEGSPRGSPKFSNDEKRRQREEMERREREEEEELERLKKQQELEDEERRLDEELRLAEEEERQRQKEREALEREIREEEQRAKLEKEREAKQAKAKQEARKPKTRRVRKAKQEGPWEVGDRVMAMFDEDELWYKAKITKKMSDDEFKVLFLEYGNSQVCEDNMLQPIPEDELSEGDEVEEPITEDEMEMNDVRDNFSDELDSMMAIPKPVKDFDDDDEDEDEIAPPPPIESSDEDEHQPRPPRAFSSEEEEEPQQTVTSKKKLVSIEDSDEESDELPPPPALSDDDDDDEEIEVKPTLQKTKKPLKSFDDDSDDFYEAPVKKVEKKSNKPVIKSFDSDEDDEVVVPKKKKEEVKKPAPVAKKVESKKDKRITKDDPFDIDLNFDDIEF